MSGDGDLGIRNGMFVNKLLKGPRMALLERLEGKLGRLGNKKKS